MLVRRRGQLLPRVVLDKLASLPTTSCEALTGSTRPSDPAPRPGQPCRLGAEIVSSSAVAAERLSIGDKRRGLTDVRLVAPVHLISLFHRH